MEKNDPEQTAIHETKVNTTEPDADKASPRQPNDRDESPDSQASPPRAVIRQAAADVASGQVNTDRYGQPEKNPKNTAPSTPAPQSSEKLPDGRDK